MSGKSLPNITARIDKLLITADSKTKAYASIFVGGAVAVHGIRVVDSKKGFFVSMPSSEYVNKDGKTKYRETAHPISKDAREVINSKVLKAYHNAVANKQ